MTPTPLLIISDAPTAGTGLGRITKDLATRIAANLQDVYRVATFGGGGQYSRHLSFPQYDWQQNDEFVMHELPEVWQDFAGDEKGIVLTIWDASRLLWFARPDTCAYPRLKQFLQTTRLRKWGYFPIDATGPNDKLTGILAHTISAYDRVLCYSKWAANIVDRTLAYQQDTTQHLPHGIDTSVFKPRHRHTARHGFGERLGAKQFGIPDDALAIGIVATNQPRKDFGLGVSTVTELAKKRKVFLWVHTDRLENHWSIPALLNDFRITKSAVVSCGNLSDEAMSWCYSAMDVTLGIGLGEGFGYPIFESLACGTPCIHGHYGGAVEHLPLLFLVRVPGEVKGCFRMEGPYNCVRPVFDPFEWAENVNYVADKGIKTQLPDYLDWNNLWPRWEEWLRKGIA